MFFCCAFFFRGLKPTTRNIEPPTRFQANVSHLFLILRELCELRVRFLRRLRQPRTSGSKRLFCERVFFLYQQGTRGRTPSRGRFRLRHFVIHTTNVSYSLLLPTAFTPAFFEPFNDFLMTIFFSEIQRRLSFFVRCVDVGAAFYKPLGQFQISGQNRKM